MNATSSRALRAPVAAVMVAIASIMSACSSLPAPRTWVPKPDTAPQDPLGSWANVRCIEQDEKVTYSGELIAVEPDSLFISTPEANLLGLPWDHINRVQVVSFDPQEAAAYGLGWAGAFSSFSHGWFVVFSFPIWLGISAGAGNTRVDEAVLQYPRETDNRAELRMYARFPQGMPSTFHPSSKSAVHRPGPAVETSAIPTYHPPERLGSGIVASGALFEGGSGAWSAGYHYRAHKELFAMGGYTRFNRDVVDMDQWWAGLRLGDPAFIGAKYNYTSQLDDHASGVSAFVGVLTPTSEHVAIGIMVGYDWTGLNHIPLEDEEYLWTAFLLQLTVFPAHTE